MPTDPVVWKIHSGLNGDGGLLDSWQRSSIVTVGFSGAEPVSDLSRRALIDLFSARGHRGAGVQIARFRDDVHVGELVIAPARQLGLCYVGAIAGGYHWSARAMAGDHHHWREATWLGRLDLNELPEAADRALIHRWTLTRIPDPAATWFADAASEALPN